MKERVKSEQNSGVGKIGTTGRGIGPAYEDKIARRANPHGRSRGSGRAGAQGR